MSSGIKIEVGGYKTRGGEDVTVIAVVDGIAIGYFTEYGPTSVNYWKAENGGYFTKHDAESSCDIVSKKPKRINIDGWLRIYKRSDGSFYTSVIEHKKPSCKEAVAIAKIVIDWVENTVHVLQNTRNIHLIFWAHVYRF